MKKIIYSAMAVAMLATTSCKDDFAESFVGEEATVEFSISTPEIGTRAYSDGTTATKLQYAVYEANDAETLTKVTGELTNFDGNETISLTLKTGKDYKVVFWAAAPNAPYTVNFAEKTMTVNYTGAVSNDESRDAFYAVATVNTSATHPHSVELKRPFAQLNIGTNDYATAAKANYEPKYSKVVVKQLKNQLNLLTGDVKGDAADITFGYSVIPNKQDGYVAENKENFPVTGYEYLAMNYLLVPADQEVVDVTFYHNTDGTSDIAENTKTVGSVPVRRNYRTNLYGKLLTSNADIKVEIKPAYETPDENVSVWDGKSVTEPTQNDQNQYVIDEASDLAWLAAAVNGTLTRSENETFAGKTFVLTTDVNLNGKEWTPIGTSEKPYTGVFDGNGHTIANLVVNGGSNSYIGLFGNTHNGEIKNLTVENAKVSGRLNVGVVAGQPYTSKYTNITVKGHVEVNGMAYVGAVGGKNAYADWTNITVNVDKTSYVNANSVENGVAYRTYVGGVCGFNGEGGHTFKDITSNINVKGSTCDVGGLFGIAHYGNKFENCECSGNVEIYAADPDDADEAQEIGGIAGVWHNGGSNVEFTNCSFTGTLKTNIEGVDLSAKTLVGAAYSATGTGKLIINGATAVSTAEELAEAVNNGETNLYLLDGEYDVYNCGGKTLTLSGSKNAVLKVTNEGEDGCDYAFGGNGTGVGDVTFNGLTINTTDNTGTYKGFAYMKGTFNDCKFEGAYSLNNANDFVFKGCTFDFKNGYFWTWAANTVTFNGCTFNGNSKNILAHGYASSEINIKDCKFAATEKGYTGAGDWTACVEIDPAGTNTYTINFTGNNTKTDSYAGWTRVKDDSTGHTITGLN